MKLYLVQHGDAVSKDVDPERPLSEKGHRDMARVSAFLHLAGVTTRHVLHSGKARAEQSAAALAAVVLTGGSVEPIHGIAPNDPVEKFAPTLARRREDTMLVGHLPFMTRLAGYLLAGSADAALLTYQPGSVACLERLDSGEWRLNWMLRPELLPD